MPLYHPTVLITALPEFCGHLFVQGPCELVTWMGRDLACLLTLSPQGLHRAGSGYTAAEEWWRRPQWWNCDSQRPVKFLQRKPLGPGPGRCPLTWEATVPHLLLSVRAGGQLLRATPVHSWTHSPLPTRDSRQELLSEPHVQPINTMPSSKERRQA